MKIDTEKMKKYAVLDDAKLWSEILAVANEHGIKLKSGMPPHEDLERVRRVLRGEEKIGMMEGMRILNKYKDKK